MSRIGNKPITVPAGIDVKIDGQHITVKGPKGTLERTVEPEISMKLEDGILTVSRDSDVRRSKSLHGLTRTLINNMIIGVQNEFTRELQINGVGYRVQKQGNNLNLSLGYSHPVIFEAPEGITFDVPNANIMVIEDAERFGLAQLHQLRGRVGRGEYKSYCVLKFKGKGQNTKERMKIMCETNDGFLISQKDLELRGSGDFFGTMQHGIPDFKIANLFTDMDILKLAQEAAIKVVSNDPKLEKEENKLLKLSVKNKFTDRIEI